MGGVFSGRPGGWGRPIVEDALTLCVDRMVRAGVIQPEAHEEGIWSWSESPIGLKLASLNYVATTGPDDGVLDLSYTLSTPGAAPRPIAHEVSLATTRPHFGGLRWWFVCPESGSRVRMLHLHAPTSERFLSREALGLAYSSSRENEWQRALRRAQESLGRLAVDGATPCTPKPKGMHWRTYEALVTRANLAGGELVRQSERRREALLARWNQFA